MERAQYRGMDPFCNTHSLDCVFFDLSHKRPGGAESYGSPRKNQKRLHADARAVHVGCGSDVPAVHCAEKMEPRDSELHVHSVFHLSLLRGISG